MKLFSFVLFALAFTWAVVKARAAEAATDAKATPDSIHVVLAGDSTVTDTAGWGNAFADLLAPGVRCTNFASGGQSSKSFRDTGRWAKSLEAKPTFLLIQFGHNDMPGKGPNRETDPKTSYRENLGRFVDEARAIGAKPILVTSVTRRGFDKDGQLVDGLAPYAEAMIAVATEKGVPLVDLHARSLELVMRLGPQGAADLGPMTKEGRRDGTHFSPKGADITAKLVADELRRVVPEFVPLFAKSDAAAKAPKRVMNEGETVADSDSLKNPAVRRIQDEPGLPRVLLIGDSISIGYTLQVRELLKGKANVHRIPMNGGATEVGLANMKSWLGSGKWDVIHFNFGLHDAKYASETTQRSSREQYAKNLRTLVDQMKATGAKVIFATTTPVPNGGVLSPTRKFDSIPERNKVALQVMQETGVAIDDLYSVALPVMEKVGRPNDVHFQPEGSALLAKTVAASIEVQLPNP